MQPAHGDGLTSGNLRGALFMLLGMGALLMNDVLVKLVGANLPVGEIMFLRGSMTSVMLLVICAALGVLPKLHLVFHGKVMGRSLSELIASALFLTALINLPIANVNTIVQSAPLVMTATAAILLKEAVGLRRWSATFIGFLGILLIVKPSSEAFNAYSLIALAAVLFITARDLLTRAAQLHIPSIVMSLATALVVTAGGASLAFVEDWQPPSTENLLFLFGAAVFQVIAYQSTIIAMRVGEMGFVAPFRYSIIIWSLIAGYVIWADVPDAWSLIGIGLVVAMGLYTFHREKVRHAQLRPGKPATPR